MLRFLAPLLAALLAALAFGTGAQAFSPDGATAPVTDFGGRHGFSVNVFGVDTAGAGVAEEWPTHLRIATAGLAWAYDGWTVGLAAGQLHYVVPSITEATARLATVSLGREFAAVAGGTLAAEFRANRFFAADGATENVFNTTLRWTLKF